MATTDNMVNIPLSSDEDAGNRGAGAGGVEKRTNTQQEQPSSNTQQHNIQIDQTDDFSGTSCLSFLCISWLEFNRPEFYLG